MKTPKKKKKQIKKQSYTRNIQVLGKTKRYNRRNGN